MVQAANVNFRMCCWFLQTSSVLAGETWFLTYVHYWAECWLGSLSFHYLRFHNIKLSSRVPFHRSTWVPQWDVHPHHSTKETPLVRVTNDLLDSKSSDWHPNLLPVPQGWSLNYLSRLQLMVILSSWLLSPKSLQSSLDFLYFSHTMPNLQN